MNEEMKEVMDFDALVQGLSQHLVEVSRSAGANTEFFESCKVKELAYNLKMVKEVLEMADDLKKALELYHQHIAINVVPERMDDEGIETSRFAGIGRLQVKADIRCSVLKENRENLQQWMKDNGHGSLVAESINASTLKAWVKEQKEKDKEIPEDYIKVEPFSKASVVKA